MMIMTMMMIMMVTIMMIMVTMIMTMMMTTISNLARALWAGSQSWDYTSETHCM